MSLNHRMHWIAAALAVGVIGLAGCGSSAPGERVASAAAPGAPTEAGTTPPSETADALNLVANVGIPDPPNPEHVAVSLDGFDRFGTPTNPFNPSVKDATTGSGNGTDPFGTPTSPPTTPSVPTDPTSPSTPTAPDPTPGVPLEADFEIAGEPAIVREGDLLPPDTGELKVVKIGAAAVTLQIVTGVLPDGSDTFALKVGRTLSLRNKTTGDVIAIRLKAVRTASSAETPSVPTPTPSATP